VDLGDGSPPVGSWGEASIDGGRGSGDGVRQKLKDFCKFVHDILMPDDGRCVKVHEQNTNKAVNIFHRKSTGKTNFFRLHVKLNIKSPKRQTTIEFAELLNDLMA
jgi:hypothetical protein